MGVNRSQLLKGTLDVALLCIIGNDESYGQEVFARLNEAGLPGVADASVYGALRRLELDGLLASRLVASNEGAARRYYSLTKSGRAARRDGLQAWQELVAAMYRLVGSHS